MTHANYRGDIDGLRAIAVLSVVLFHAGLALASGGFVGVDVFFVISGFLISRILLTDLEQNRFSILRFYDGRIRRIMPALGFMALLVSVAAVAVLTPLELEQFGKSLIAAAMFSSNLWFWQGTNYFAAPSHTQILLHTWSLAVEEQFYIVWPIMLWALRTQRRAYVPVVICGIVVCLIVSQYAALHSPAAAFYLLPSRAWQLAMGALLASPSVPQFRSSHVREAVAATGVFLVFYAVVAFDTATPFPGLHALVPSLGAAFVIHSGADTRTGKLLAEPPLRLVGLASYSLYLWHWPLLCLSRQYLGRGLDPIETAAALGICAVLTVVSWRYVEQPFRRGRASADAPGPAAWRSVRAASALTILLVALGGVLAVTRGLPARAPSSALEAEAALRESHDARAYCTEYDSQAPGMTACRSAHSPPRIALWGDSHAGHLATVLAAGTRGTGASLLSLIQGGCPPNVGANRVYGRLADPACRVASAHAMSTLLGYETISAVVLAARWSTYTENNPSRGEEGLPTYLTDDTSDELSASNSRRVLRASLDRVLSTLQRSRIAVFIVGQVPEFGIDTARCVAHALWRGLSETHCFAPASAARARVATSNAILRDLVAAHPGVRFVDPFPFFCDAALCRSVKDGKLLYTDDDHLSQAGAEYLLRQSGIAQRLAVLGRSRDAAFDATMAIP